ncbi:MAG: MFS transporter [Clostridia bacterium]|nr:MFS transporter [Clostridia bacterium]
MAKRYGLTVTACSTGYVVQALVNNFLPLLFVYFSTAYKIPVYLISTVIAYNFVLQILIDMLSSSFILKIGHRASCILSGTSACVGLVILAITPFVVSGYIAIYVGIMIAVTFMAAGSGLSEVLLSPIIEALPFENKSSMMSFLHSFYCLGHLVLVLLSTAFFVLFGVDKWYILALFFVLIPAIEVILFSVCPIIKPTGDERVVKKLQLFKNKRFLLLFVLMISAGACEQAIAQWASYFAESGLKVSKTMGDLLGASTFALFMFLSRFLHGLSGKKFNVSTLILICSVGLTACYLLTVLQPNAVLSLIFISLSGFFVGIVWPGVYSIGGDLFSSGGTTMFSMLALGGDVGCTLGPTLVGFIASGTSMNMGILIATIFPLLLLFGMLILKRTAKDELVKLR